MIDIVKHDYIPNRYRVLFDTSLVGLIDVRFPDSDSPIYDIEIYDSLSIMEYTTMFHFMLAKIPAAALCSKINIVRKTKVIR